MLAAQLISILIVGTGTLPADDRQTSFFELVEVGQSASLTSGNNTYSIIICTKQRKLEVLAEYQRQIERIKAERERLNGLAGEAAQPPIEIPPEPHFYRVTRVGKDFIGFDMDGNRTLIIPYWSIKRLIFEKARDEAAEQPDGQTPPPN